MASSLIKVRQQKKKLEGHIFTTDKDKGVKAFILPSGNQNKAQQKDTLSLRTHGQGAQTNGKDTRPQRVVSAELITTKCAHMFVSKGQK